MYKSKESVLFDRQVTLFFATKKENIIGSFDKEKKIRLELRFFFEHQKIYSKKKTIKRLDLDNRIKLTLDALAKHLNFNDCQIFELMVYKYAAESNFVDIEILNL